MDGVEPLSIVLGEAGDAQSVAVKTVDVFEIKRLEELQGAVRVCACLCGTAPTRVGY